MRVEVIAELEYEPTDAQLATVRYDALRLTDDPRSVHVAHTRTGDGHVLTARFTMRRQPQSKVVDIIAHEFKSGIGCEPTFRTLTIRFPKHQPARPRNPS